MFPYCSICINTSCIWLSDITLTSFAYVLLVWLLPPNCPFCIRCSVSYLWRKSIISTVECCLFLLNVIMHVGIDVTSNILSGHTIILSMKFISTKYCLICFSFWLSVLKTPFGNIKLALPLISSNAVNINA